MDSQRVREIMSSQEEINVTYNSKQVWIEGLNGDIAEIREIDSDKTFKVPVRELWEGTSAREDLRPNF